LIILAQYCVPPIKSPPRQKPGSIVPPPQAVA
jgi:hypothetical protein